MIFGVDVSAYQPNFDFAAARRDRMDFAIIKSTEGTGWRSGYYKTQVAQARAAGLLVAAYHYVRGSDVPGQLANIRSMVAPDTPVILDVEDGAGPIGSIRELNAALNRAGYRTPLIYIPRWYWQGHMGSPDLRGLPPLWHSRYPDNTVRRVEGFNLNDPAYWPSFGGLNTVIAQFTSSLAVANYPRGSIDGNAYKGTRDQLAALLGGTTAGGDDVGVVDGFSDNGFIDLFYRRKISTPDPANPNWQLGLGQLLEGAWRGGQLIESVVIPMLAKISDNPDVDVEALRGVALEAAREQGRVVAEQVGAAVSAEVRAALEQVRDADNIDEARRTADELLRRFGEMAQGGEGKA